MRVEFRKGVQGAVHTKQDPKGRRETYLICSIWMSFALSAQNLACRVRLEELEWKILFLFQERARKIFVPIIKVEI